MIAIISDIHSNIEALDAVLKDIQEQGAKDIICLGDLIGYGPNPREILLKAKDWKFALRGNHEDALLFLAMDFSPAAAQAIEWTRGVLNSEQHGKSDNHLLWNFLGDLTDFREEGDIMYVHASPRQYTREYVRPHDINDKEKMDEIFSKIKRLCFSGHTHEPGVFTDDRRFFPPHAFVNGKVKLPAGRKYVINVGSVGQPRDRDTRACYVLLEGDVVQFRRVEYDYKKTMEKILKIGEIPRRFADRLAVGM